MNKFILCILLMFCCACSSDVDLTIPNKIKEVKSYSKGEVCTYSLYNGKWPGYDTLDGPCGWASINDIVIIENNQIVVKRKDHNEN